ncbi:MULTISPECIES: hypothetical protein [Burkholderia]|uniref:Transposase n=1 Tax=Burkholderia cepacia TaxID=292 RepID=A0ABN5CW30_BURCE|nr:hypothetical protein [Burkholderia cepacia]ASE93579.1 hypothetical protein CEQ23_08005 [Burkholderia cepacia]ATF78245.1 hypothetical protein CO711_12980 [Burkholderia cepacia]MCA7892977.1 hypothetical protein [Burkholderia cepacia]MCA7941316.1 hypothetical protein [Burkholderia cepacia]MCA8058004.1 hypothetical protein [Burkholderia cepacia]
MARKTCNSLQGDYKDVAIDGKLDRSRLKGALGDAIHAVPCGAKHNLRMVLRKLIHDGRLTLPSFRQTH